MASPHTLNRTNKIVFMVVTRVDCTDARLPAVPMAQMNPSAAPCTRRKPSSHRALNEGPDPDFGHSQAAAALQRHSTKHAFHELSEPGKLQQAGVTNGTCYVFELTAHRWAVVPSVPELQGTRAAANLDPTASDQVPALHDGAQGGCSADIRAEAQADFRKGGALARLRERDMHKGQSGCGWQTLGGGVEPLQRVFCHAAPAQHTCSQRQEESGREAGLLTGRLEPHLQLSPRPPAAMEPLSVISTTAVAG